MEFHAKRQRRKNRQKRHTDGKQKERIAEEQPIIGENRQEWKKEVVKRGQEKTDRDVSER